MVPAVNDWKHKDVWVKRGENFSVEVSRHEGYVDEMRDMGPHRWCVYVYVYPTHPFFKRIADDLAAPVAEGEYKSFYPNMAGYLPLHGGCTFFHVHRNEKNEITSYQIGCDYNHYMDEHYTHLADMDDAFSVFRDAEELKAYMEQGELK